MIIYNVTIKLNHSIANEWLSWLKEEHIPDIINTGCFTHATLLRLLETDETEGPTYAVQYHAESKALYNRYIDKFSGEMRKKERINGVVNSSLSALLCRLCIDCVKDLFFLFPGKISVTASFQTLNRQGFRHNLTKQPAGGPFSPGIIFFLQTISSLFLSKPCPEWLPNE